MTALLLASALGALTILIGQQWARVRKEQQEGNEQRALSRSYRRASGGEVPRGDV